MHYFIAITLLIFSSNFIYTENIMTEFKVDTVVDLAGTDIGTSIKISSVKLEENVFPTISDRDFVIATVASPTVIKEPEKPAEAAEGAEGAEGEAAAAESTDGEAKAASPDSDKGEKKDDTKKGDDKKAPADKKAADKK